MKRHYYGLVDECWRYTAPGLNPFETGANSELTTTQRDGAGTSRNEHLFDSTLAMAAERLANRMVSEGFPDGTHWAQLQPGTALRPGVEPEEPSEDARERMEHTQARIFEAIHAANSGLALLQMVMDGVVSGTGVMKVGVSQDSGTLLDFEAVNQAHVALEPGPMGKVWGVYRRMELTRDEILSLWPDATGVPEDDEDPRQSMPRRHDIHEATYYDRLTGLWYYDVILQTDGGGDSDGSRLISSRDYQVSPWLVWRYKLLSGEVQGRSPTMTALPDARTLNHAKRIRLEAASVRSLGIYTYKSGGIFNPRVVRLVSGAFLPVGSNARDNPDVAPLELSGDVQLNELVIEALQESIRMVMLDFALPDPEGAVRSATEIIERQAEARQQRGQPFLRMMEEIGRSMLRLVAYLLQELGHLPELADLRPASPKTGRPVPLMLDGTDVVVQFASPLAQAQTLSEAQSIVQWGEATIAIAGVEAWQSGAKVEELARVLNPLFRAPATLVRDEETAANMMDDSWEARMANPVERQTPTTPVEQRPTPR